VERLDIVVSLIVDDLVSVRQSAACTRVVSRLRRFSQGRAEPGVPWILIVEPAERDLRRERIASLLCGLNVGFQWC